MIQNIPDKRPPENSIGLMCQVVVITGKCLPALSTLLVPTGCHHCSGSEVRCEFVMSEPKRKLDLKSKKLLSGWGPCLHIVRSVAQDERAGPGQLPL